VKKESFFRKIVASFLKFSDLAITYFLVEFFVIEQFISQRAFSPEFTIGDCCVTESTGKNNHTIPCLEWNQIRNLYYREEESRVKLIEDEFENERNGTS
jgi:hypothetical protein